MVRDGRKVGDEGGSGGKINKRGQAGEGVGRAGLRVREDFARDTSLCVGAVTAKCKLRLQYKYNTIKYIHLRLLESTPRSE